MAKDGKLAFDASCINRLDCDIGKAHEWLKQEYNTALRSELATNSAATAMLPPPFKDDPSAQRRSPPVAPDDVADAVERQVRDAWEKDHPGDGAAPARPSRSSRSAYVRAREWIDDKPERTRMPRSRASPRRPSRT